MEKQSSEHESRTHAFINRKRPAMEGIVQDLLGPTSLLDEVISGKPFFPERENEFEPDGEVILKDDIQKMEEPED